MRQRQPPEWYATGIRTGTIAVLSQAITLAESQLAADHALVRQVLALLAPLPHTTVRLGVSGSPGVGKSTFIEALGLYWTGRGKRVAVLAVDPSSSRSGGSILGDKTRMAGLAAERNAYIRPSPAAGALGGVNRATRESILLCEAAGFDWIIVETVGVGQSEIAVRSMVDVFLLLLQPAGGDELQGIKRGIMEMADVLAVTKADIDPAAAERTAAEYRAALHLYPPGPGGWTAPVVPIAAPTGLGLDGLDAELLRFVLHQQNGGYWQQQRQAQQEDWFVQAAEQVILQRFFADEVRSTRFRRLRADVAAGRLLPGAALAEIMKLM